MLQELLKRQPNAPIAAEIRTDSPGLVSGGASSTAAGRPRYLVPDEIQDLQPREPSVQRIVPATSDGKNREFESEANHRRPHFRLWAANRKREEPGLRPKMT